MDLAIRFQENELLKNERSLRRSRVGAIILIILALIATTATFNKPLTGTSLEVNTFLRGFCLLLAALGYKYHLQLKHIQSIKMYRQRLGELIGND